MTALVAAPPRHPPETHGPMCSRCRRRAAKWHVDCGTAGCSNLCGVCAGVVKRRSLSSAVHSDPIIVPDYRCPALRDGGGHVPNPANLRYCARCGGRIPDPLEDPDHA
jgi:hypothetical protein